MAEPRPRKMRYADRVASRLGAAETLLKRHGHAGFAGQIAAILRQADAETNVMYRVSLLNRFYIGVLKETEAREDLAFLRPLFRPEPLETIPATPNA